MNRVFNTVWNYTLNAWVVASEHTSQCGKRGGAARRMINGVGILGLTIIGSNSALAVDLPVGGQIVHGNGQISTPNSNKMVIDQASQKLAIDWQKFDIGSGNTVTFKQPDSQSIALNRVLGSDGSKIMGTLEANGRVFLVNPSGVLFGAGSSVDVGGLVASTLDINVDDFAAGNYRFKGNGNNASVINNGSITATDGGAVALLGGTVSNNGVIVAKQDSVALAAGNTISLDFVGDGLLSVQVDEAVIDALVENNQLIKADGGQVLLTANAGEALLKTVVNNIGVIEAQTLGEKNGKIVLLGGFDGGTTLVSGTLDASAPDGGSGGFIETSGAHVKITDSAKVTTLADTGKSGTWLIDPNDFNVAASDGDMTGAAVSNALHNNGNFIIETATSGTTGGNGDIHINDAIEWSNSSALTLSAERDINISADISSTNSGKLALEYGQGSVAADNSADYHLKNDAKVNLTAGDNFSTKLGSDGDTFEYRVITELGSQGSTTGEDLQGINGDLTGSYVLGSDIDASDTNDWSDSYGLGFGFTPIDKFSGTFDGLGHHISGLVINRYSTNVGLFGTIDSASTVQNIGMLGGAVTGVVSVGGIVGYNDGGKISNAYSTADVTGSSYTGGLVGYNNGGGISNAYATGVITGSGNVGGLVGYNDNGIISNVYAIGAVTGSSGFVGGLIGLSKGTISDAYATGAVKGSEFSGGLIGSSEGALNNVYATGNVTGDDSPFGSFVGGLIGHSRSSINNAYATGAVKGSRNVGGLVGWSYEPVTNAYATGAVVGESQVGGLIGANYNEYNEINNVYATGNVRGVHGVGGLVGSGGMFTTINNAYASGTVKGIDFVGGLVGHEGFEGTITNSYASGAAEGQRFVGGLVGSSSGQNNSFYAVTDADGVSINNGGSYSDIYTGNNAGVGKSFAELLKLSTFEAAGWSIDSVGSSSNAWRIYDGNSTPLLRSFLKAATVTLDTSIASTSKTYDGSIVSNRFTYTTDQPGVVLGGTATYSSASADAGTYSSTDGTLLYGLFSDQQGYDVRFVGDPVLTITPKALAIKGLQAGDKVYDGTTHAALSGGILDGLVGDETLTLSDFIGDFSDANAGANKTVSVTGGSLGDGSGLASNYSIINPTGLIANISRANLTVTANDASKTYDGQTWSGGNGLTYAGFVNNEDASVLAGQLEYTGNAQSAVNAGSYVLTAKGLEAANYQIAYGNGSLIIDPKALTLSGLRANNKVYDGNTAATLTGGRLEGLVGDETLSLANFTGTFTDQHAGTNKTVNIAGASLSDGSGLASNYSLIHSADLTASITPKALNISGLSVSDKVYDGTTHAALSGGILDGLVGDETLTLSDFIGDFSDANAGANKAVGITGGFLGDGSGLASNYSVMNPTGLTGDISRASLTVTANDANKTYDGQMWSGGNGLTYAGFVNNEDASVLGGQFEYTGNAQGAVNAGSYTLGAKGLEAANYHIAYGDGSLIIDPKALTLSGLRASDKVYDGNTSATLTGGILDGLVGDETLTLTSLTGTFVDQNAGANKTVSVIGGSLGDGSGLASNYSIINPTGLTADISRANLTVTANDAHKTYDGQVWSGGNGMRYEGFVNGENASVLDGEALYGGSAQGARDFGSYTINVDGLIADNYAISYQDGVLKIAKPSIIETTIYSDILASLPVEAVLKQDSGLSLVESNEPNSFIDNVTIIESGIRLPGGL